MSKTATRNDFLPVILSGDISVYPMARAFYEAFGVSTTCIVPGCAKVIAHSRFLEPYLVPDMELPTVREALYDIANKHAQQMIIALANWDAGIEMLEEMEEGAPQNIRFIIPPREARLRAADKATFAQMCAEHGIDTPYTEVVHLAGTDPIPASEIAFPLVAKPAVSGEYSDLILHGFQKVYFMHEQAELDKLWADLRAYGFEGDFLVQELITGDDTYMDSITMYVNSEGKTALCSSAQVILEDHVPNQLGNPVAMITRPMPELWEKVSSMLEGIGWRGFANFDLKRDPKTGRVVFMDFNPRIGANSYYSALAGENPMEVLVEDVIDHASVSHKIEVNALYHRVPVSLARRYILDEKLRSEFDAIVRAGREGNPTRCPVDTLRSQFYGWLMERNYVRKFAQYYPKPTETSF